jgi:hypothetical protein
MSLKMALWQTHSGIGRDELHGGLPGPMLIWKGT